MTALDLDRITVLQRLEEEGIWYMPLKGAVLKDLYPKVGMRQMSDNDILIDSDRAEDVRKIMEDLGFTAIRYGKRTHDIYHKQPVSSFEMHRDLFGLSLDIEVYMYYKNIKKNLLKDDIEKNACRFRDEDFYCYMIVHEFKHYSHGGTGIRSLLDTWVYLKHMEDSLDWEYIQNELEKLNICSFEEQNRSLAIHLFEGEDLTESDRDMMEYIITSGTYGTSSHKVQYKMKENGWGKWQYIIKRFLVPFSKKNPSYDRFAIAYPSFYRKKILLPLLPFYRAVRAMKNGKLKSEWKAWKKQ